MHCMIAASREMSDEPELFENPFMGIDLGKHLRKIRLAITSKGKGKSGGARVITYVISDRENISDKELLDLLKQCE